MGPMKRSRPPDQKLFDDILGDVDPPLLTHLLFNKVHGEDGSKVLGTDRLPRSWVDQGLKGGWQIGLNIIPLLRNLIFPEEHLELLHLLLLL
jgi:hypothetical protein